MGFNNWTENEKNTIHKLAFNFIYKHLCPLDHIIYTQTTMTANYLNIK